MSGIGPFRERLLRVCKEWQVRGSILLSNEGILVAVTLPSDRVASLHQALRSVPTLGELVIPGAACSHQPYERIVVRIVRSLPSPSTLPTDGVPTLTTEQHRTMSPLTPSVSVADSLAMRLEHRHRLIREAVNPLPGSTPRDEFKRVAIPQSMDCRTLLDTLHTSIPHITREDWEAECSKGLLLDSEDNAVGADQLVRAGQVYRHKFPAVIEPGVDGNVELLHEDEALVVVNKPAPLPMHAGGRFFRNTLQHILSAAYHPEVPRPAHRLDANTTGLVLVTRTRQFASRLQNQFAQGEVRKRYLVRIQGHPREDRFVCDAPIRSVSGPVGSRDVDLENGLPAHTGFRVLERDASGTTLLEACPTTGRTHQIRVHLWHLGFPVCGDRIYLPGGKFGVTQTLGLGDPPLCLHAWHVAFKHPMTLEQVEFTAPVPAWRQTLRDGSKITSDSAAPGLWPGARRNDGAVTEA